MNTYREEDHPRDKTSGQWETKPKPTTGVTLAAPKVDWGEVERLADEYRQIGEQLDELTARKNEIRDRLVGQLPDGSHTAGERTLTVIHPRTLDVRALSKAYPQSKHPDLYKATLDTAKVRAMIAPVDLTQYQVAGTAQVRIR